MSRRIDIELTSDRGDGTWTWRAAGAKQPKGVLDASLLPAGASTDQVLRAEIDFALDGATVIAVLPPKEKNRAQVETLELIGRPVRDDELVTSKLAGKGKGRGDRRDRGDRPDRGDRDGRGRGRDGGPRRDGERRGGGDRGPRGPRGEGGERGDRGPRSDRPRRDRPAPPPKPKAKRLRPARTHRKAAIDALSPAEQVIAEQVLMGGIPAVRQAVAKQNEQAKLAGGREVAAEPIVAVAEKLLPGLRAAEWRDKAEAALADIDELDLRDLRSVVVAADGAAKDDEARELADQLRAGLVRRQEQEHTAWLDELRTTLTEGRVVRALRLSSRPPKAGAPLPADLATQLTEAASAALTADTFDDRWATVLDAVSFSPVRLGVAPASKPETPSEALVATITRFSGRVPKVAEAFGIEPVAEPAGKGRRPSRGRPKGAKAPAPKPPKPPKPPVAESSPAPKAPHGVPDETAPEEVSSVDLAEAVSDAPEPATPEVAPEERPVEAVAPDETAPEEVSSLDLGGDDTPAGDTPSSAGDEPEAP